MATMNSSAASASRWSKVSSHPVTLYIWNFLKLVLRNWLPFGVYLIFVLMVADAFGQSFGLPHLFRNDPAILNDHGLAGYLLTALRSSPGVWGHVAVTLLLITILCGVTVKEVLHDQEQKLTRSSIVNTLVKYGWFFVALQIGAVIYRNVREGAPFFLSVLEVTEAAAGVALASGLAVGSIFLTNKVYYLAYRQWAHRPFGLWSTRVLKAITVQSLWHNSSDHAPWILLYFIAGVLIVAGPFLYLEDIVPGVALCILVILVVVIYFAVGSIRPMIRNPLILAVLLTYSSCSYDPFKIKLPDFTVAGNNGEKVDLYDCPLQVESRHDDQADRNFACDAFGNPFTTAALTRSIGGPVVKKGKDPTAASDVVKGDGALDLDTCIMMEAWRARSVGDRPTRDELERRCRQGPSRLVRSVTPSDPALASNRTDKPKLVVVTASGGAYRAGFWTALVLDELIDRSEKGRNLENIADNIKLLTGASGGMVASAYFAALSSETDWSSPSPPTITDRLLQDIKNSRDQRFDQTEAPGKFKTRFPIDRDSLGPVAQQTLQRDVIRSVLWPLPFKSLLAWEDWDDRGLVLEQQWATLDKTFGDLRDGWINGEVPSLILSPMIVDTGQPLMISNANIANTLDRSEDAAVSLFKMFPEMLHQMKVQTAVRLNASFPYISPAVSLPTTPKMRIVDAGYYDNYGVNTAIAWLSQPGMIEYLREATSGVIIIQVRAYSTEPPTSNGPDKPDIAYLPEWLTSPITGVSQARNSSMLFRNTKELKLFSSLFCDGFVKTVAFENTLGEHDISMSWYLRQDELDRMRTGLSEAATAQCRLPKDDDNLTAEQQADCALNTFNQEVFDELETIWQSDQTSHPSCRKWDENHMAAGTIQ